MLYIERDQDGRIISINNEPSSEDCEVISPLDEEVIEYLSKNNRADELVTLLSKSDIGIIRIIEDLIYLLIKKNIIMFTELPPPAQEKLIKRRKVRKGLENSFIIDKDDIL